MGVERMRRSVGRLGVLALAVLGACDAPTVPRTQHGYADEPNELSLGFYYRWERGKTIALYVDPTGVPQGFDLASAAREAADRWYGQTFYDEYRFAFVDDPVDADVIIHYKFAPRLVDVGDCDAGNAVAETTFCVDAPRAPVLPLLDGRGGRVKVDVNVDPLGPSEFTLAQAGQTRAEYLVTLLTHELGHVLGIGSHRGDNSDIMRAIPLVEKPSRDDARTLRYILRQDADILL